VEFTKTLRVRRRKQNCSTRNYANFIQDNFKAFTKIYRRTWWFGLIQL